MTFNQKWFMECDTRSAINYISDELNTLIVEQNYNEIDNILRGIDFSYEPAELVIEILAMLKPVADKLNTHQELINLLK